jgi:hypothetical protein
MRLPHMQKLFVIKKTHIKQICGKKQKFKQKFKVLKKK